MGIFILPVPLRSLCSMSVPTIMPHHPPFLHPLTRLQGALLYLLSLGNSSKYLPPSSWVGTPRDKAWMRAKQDVTWIVKRFGAQDQEAAETNYSSNNGTRMTLRSVAYGSLYHMIFLLQFDSYYQDKSAFCACKFAEPAASKYRGLGCISWSNIERKPSPLLPQRLDSLIAHELYSDTM